MNRIIQIEFREPAVISVSVNMNLVNKFTLLLNSWEVYEDDAGLVS